MSTYQEIKKYNSSDEKKYNLNLRSTGKPATKDDWKDPEMADGVPILARTKVTNSDPNIRIAYDNFSTIQNQKASYLASNVTRTYSDGISDDVKEKYKSFDQLNIFKTLMHDMMISCAGWGNTYSLCYLDDDVNVRMKEVQAWQAKVEYDDNGEPKYGYVYYCNDEKELILHKYDKTTVTEYQIKDDKEQEISSSPHGFTEMPVIEWKNNTQRRGNAQKSVTLIDAYDGLMSDGVTESATFRRAYLMLKNVGIIDEETKAEMKKTGVIVVDSENGEVKFVTKDVNPAYTELMLNRVWAGIWVVACSVDPLAMSVLKNATAFQIAQMLGCLEQDSQNTEMRWQKSLEYMDRVLKSYWTGLDTQPVGDYDTYNINYQFIRNLPKDILSELEALKRAGAMLPQEEIFKKYGYEEEEAEALAEKAAEELTTGLPEIE